MNSNVRVLHVLGAMNRGGVETWLMHVLRRLDRASYRMDFLVHSNEPGAFDAEIESLGSRIFRCGGLRNPLRYAHRFRSVLQQHGPYDVVHSHAHAFSGLVVRLAASCGVPIRIAHSHSDTRSNAANRSVRRRAYLALMRRWIQQYATVRLAPSTQAATDLFGQRWQLSATILPCGIDLEPFRRMMNAASVRQELGISPADIVIGHVGRFEHPKNHSFLLDIAVEVLQKLPQARFLLVGEGSLRAAMEQKARNLQILDRVILAGLRPDAPRLMVGAMDVFLFPSLYEGLPLSLLEAQAAGLPCVISDTIDPRIDVIPALLDRLPLTAPAERWASAVAAAASGTRRYPAEECCAILDNSSFSASESTNQLARLYSREYRDCEKKRLRRDATAAGVI